MSRDRIAEITNARNRAPFSEARQVQLFLRELKSVWEKNKSSPRARSSSGSAPDKLSDMIELRSRR
jgi:hypothetical protein